ncbi:Unknown protein sequence [Pseudomonas savastanoi pv. phaseolicola]|nr:Unknown protein sequence [Pseudomonas savastanoi pv. phaseolicola]
MITGRGHFDCRSLQVLVRIDAKQLFSGSDAAKQKRLD